MLADGSLPIMQHIINIDGLLMPERLLASKWSGRGGMGPASPADPLGEPPG